MNTAQTTQTQPVTLPAVKLFEPIDPVLCALPDFVKVPAVPGLPTELTGLALRDALQARAQRMVSLRHPLPEPSE
jgi:hypothetical protein